MRVAVCQMSSGEDIVSNFDTACALVEDASERGAEFIGLPENTLYLGPKKGLGGPIAGPKASRWIHGLADLAKHFGVYLLVGSVREKIPRKTKVHNTALLFDSAGKLISTYRKIHLFDIHVPGRVTERESSIYDPGRDAAPVAVGDFSVGVTICYDLRFPELYRRLSAQGVDLFCVPSNFTLMTGKDHWRALLVARAIENQAFVMAPAQCGAHHGGRRSYGHSMIVDPWGTVLAEAPEDWTGVVTADLDRDVLTRVRTNMPSLTHRRMDIFKP